MQSPISLARDYCANFLPDGSCLGAQLNDDGCIPIARKLPACLLASPVRKCAYFEQCVAPIEITLKAQLTNRADWPKNPRARASLPGLVADFSDALHQYRNKSGSLFSAKRKCPDCPKEKVSLLEPGKQRCPVCQTARAKASQRRRDSKHHFKSTES